MTGPPVSELGLVYDVTHGEVWWGVYMRPVETLSTFGPCPLAHALNTALKSILIAGNSNFLSLWAIHGQEGN